MIVYATPPFFLGLMAQLVFGVWLGWLPTSDQASPLTQALLQTHTNIFLVDAIWDGSWGALWAPMVHRNRSARLSPFRWCANSAQS